VEGSLIEESITADYQPCLSCRLIITDAFEEQESTKLLDCDWSKEEQLIPNYAP